MNGRIALLGLALVGCAVPKEAGFPDVARAVEERTGHRVAWRQGGDEDRAVERAVKDLLAKELGPDEAVQVALLENHRLQAVYEELLVAQADVVEAGLLKNPALSAGVLFPTQSGLPKITASVEQDFLSLLLIPARKRLAGSAFEAAKLRVGDAVLTLAADARSAFFMLQGAQQIAAMRGAIASAGEVSLEIAKRQHEAGNISDLDLANEEALFEQIRLDLARSEAEVLGARERLTRLCGLFGQDAAFKITPKLPDLPAEEPPLEHLESLAIARRLDVAAAQKDVQSGAYALALATNFRFLGGAEIGAELEREKDGDAAVGPTARLELPIFDQKQAEVARLEAGLRAKRATLRAIAVDARSEVREARGRVLAARATAMYYRTTVIPLRERIVALTQQHYDAMLLGVFQLLAAKQSEVNAYREYIEAVRDYWVARVELDRAAGGRIQEASKK